MANPIHKYKNSEALARAKADRAATAHRGLSLSRATLEAYA